MTKREARIEAYRVAAQALRDEASEYWLPGTEKIGEALQALADNLEQRSERMLFMQKLDKVREQ